MVIENKLESSSSAEKHDGNAQIPGTQLNNKNTIFKSSLPNAILMLL